MQREREWEKFQELQKDPEMMKLVRTTTRRRLDDDYPLRGDLSNPALQMQYLELFLSNLRSILPGFIHHAWIQHNEIWLVTHRDRLIPLLMFLRDNTSTSFEQLGDIVCVDMPGKRYRFEIYYCLLSFTCAMRTYVMVQTDEVTPVPSVTSLFGSADPQEREVWDMFGVFFTGHPDLRRIFTDYGFKGHPLRKDFPLTGFYEVSYNESEKQVLYEPVEITQEYRNFYFNRPWTGKRPA